MLRTVALFHSSGIFPLFSDWVYNKKIGCDRLLAQFFSNCGCKQSGPVALFGFTVDSLLYTPDSVILISFNVQKL